MSMQWNRPAKLYAPGFNSAHNSTEQQYSQEGSHCVLVGYMLDFLHATNPLPG
jgi:hypothetical protein